MKSRSNSTHVRRREIHKSGAFPFAFDLIGIETNACFDFPVVIDETACQLTCQIVIGKSPGWVKVVIFVIDLEYSLGLDLIRVNVSLFFIPTLTRLSGFVLFFKGYINGRLGLWFETKLGVAGSINTIRVFPVEAKAAKWARKEAGVFSVFGTVECHVFKIKVKLF